MLDLRETIKVSAEIVRQVLAGKSSEEILSNIDIKDEILAGMVDDMDTLTSVPLAFVSSEDDTWFTGYVNIVEYTDEFAEKFGEDEDFEAPLLAHLHDSDIG